MSIILIGMKNCGKTTIGRLLAETMGIPFLDADTALEKTHRQETGEVFTFRQIYQHYGVAYFRALETRTLQDIAQEDANTNFVFACGGQTPLHAENQEILAALGTIIFLHVERDILLQRILTHGIPAFFPYADDPERSLDELLAQRVPVYQKLAAITVDAGKGTAGEVAHAILKEVRTCDQH
jgi:shikimate kinase